MSQKEGSKLPGNILTRQNIYNLAILAILLVAAILRIRLYGDIRLSIAGNDTPSYIEASQVPLFSKEIMTGRRLLTTNLLYKVFEPGDGYQILVNGSIETTRRVIQPGFNIIVILQTMLSIIGWSFLALTVSKYIKNPLMKFLSTIIIIAFAFVPQIADWDSILLSESLTFSLFALQLAFLIKLVFIAYQGNKSSAGAYLVIWAFIFFLWTFLRDTNLFASFVTIGMISILFFFANYRKNKYLYGILAFVVSIFILGLITSSNSTRALVQIVNIYNDDLFPHPARVATLKELGMPVPKSEEYKLWFQKHSRNALLKFMMIHPGYPATKIIRDFPDSFTEIKQTYFTLPGDGKSRKFLMALGDALHPENTTPFLISLFLLTGLIVLAVNNGNETSQPWAWLGIWLFLTASITLIPTILGDTWAINRHALFSTMTYRLFMWIFFIVIMDAAIDKSGPKFRVVTGE